MGKVKLPSTFARSMAGMRIQRLSAGSAIARDTVVTIWKRSVTLYARGMHKHKRMNPQLKERLGNTGNRGCLTLKQRHTGKFDLNLDGNYFGSYRLFFCPEKHVSGNKA